MNGLQYFTTIAVFFLAIGTFTSVSLQAGYQIFFSGPVFYWAWRALRNKSSFSKSSLWLLMFLLVALVSILWNLEVVANPTKDIGRLRYFALFILAPFPLREWLKQVSTNTLKALFNTLVAGIVISASYLIYHRVMLGDPAHRAMTETMRYGYGLGLVFVILIGLFLHRKKIAWVSSASLIVGIVFCFFGILFINSRGTLFSILVATPFLFWYFDRKIGICVGAIAIFLISLFAWNYFRPMGYMGPIRILQSNQFDTDQTRFSQWRAALIAWQERPYLGWGMGNFYSQVQRIKIEHDLPAKTYNKSHAHSVLLEVSAGAGIFAVVFFLAWFFTWMWECWQMAGVTRVVMIPFFVTLIIQAQVEFILDANNISWLGFVYGITSALREEQKMSLL